MVVIKYSIGQLVRGLETANRFKLE